MIGLRQESVFYTSGRNPSVPINRPECKMCFEDSIWGFELWSRILDRVVKTLTGLCVDWGQEEVGDRKWGLGNFENSLSPY